MYKDFAQAIKKYSIGIKSTVTQNCSEYSAFVSSMEDFKRISNLPFTENHKEERYIFCVLNIGRLLSELFGDGTDPKFNKPAV